MSISARWLSQNILMVDTTYRNLTDADLNLYVIRGTESVVLIDAGITSTTSGARAAISAVAQADLRIDSLFITHGHEDHFGGAASWSVEFPELRIAGPLIDAPWIESHERTQRELWEGLPGVFGLDDISKAWARENLWGDPVTLDVLIRDDDEFALGGAHLVAIETGGHSPGHLAYLETGSGTLFSGDLVQGRGLRSVSGRTLQAPLYMDVDAYRSGLRRLVSLDFEILAPAHTPPVPRQEALDLIQASLDFVDDVEALVDRMVGDADALLTSDVAMAIGTELGAFGGIGLGTARVAEAHLWNLAKSGRIRPAWVAIDKPPLP